MKLTKRLLAVFLAALMLATIAPFVVAAPVTYTIADGVLTVSGQGEMDSYSAVIPDWRAKANEITSIVVGDGITAIGAYAFKDLVNVTDVTLPASVTSIGAYAFSNCTALKNIRLPAESTSVARGTFADCKALTAITIPDKVETICSYAFSGTGLTEIFLPLSVKTIEKYAFSNCTALKKITIKNTKCNIISDSLPPATPIGSDEEPVTIYAVYNSNGDNYAIANNYAVVNIPDEDKPATATPESIQEVIQISEQELKETKIGAFFRRLFELLGLTKKEAAVTVESAGSGSGSGEAASDSSSKPLVITGPGAEIGNFIMKTSLASFIMTLREAFASLFGNFKLSF